MATAYLSHSSFLAHDVPGGHPESSRRLSAIADRLQAAGVDAFLRHYQAPRATRQQVERVHTPRLIDQLCDLAPATGYAAVDADTFLGTHTLDAAWHAAGAAIMATDLVVDGQVDNAFCAVRPPGHHAERDQAMGFCFFNNVAVGVAHALEVHGVERVAVIDFDVHHGNGTEQIFADDERVLLCSSFQSPFYPFTGADTQSSHIVNVPLPAGTRSLDYRSTVADRWTPAIDGFRPQLIFVSAGFDGHVEDTMAELMLVDDDYRWLTELIVGYAHRHARGRIVSSLEGGYALDALGRSACAHVRGLVEAPPAESHGT